jgi:hypothetical protein
VYCSDLYIARTPHREVSIQNVDIDAESSVCQTQYPVAHHPLIQDSALRTADVVE